jgi:hypothetical protein
MLCCSNGWSQSAAKKQETQRRPRFCAMAGISMNTGANNVSPAFHVILERPVSDYTYLGMQYNITMRTDLDPSSDIEISADNFELGVHVKRFFNGVWSGRRSGFFTGADIRLAARQYSYAHFGIEPLFPLPAYEYLKGTSYRFMGLAGYRYEYSRAFVEISLPLGLETNKIDDKGYFLPSFDENNLVILPLFCLGYSF